MESSKLSVKFYFEDESSVKLADIVPAFHSWIQFHSIADHLLIDVADYAHVPDGPGVVLVSHEANFYLDRFDSRLGLTYSRKQPLSGTFADRVRFVFHAALEACQLLESNATLGGVTFRTNEASFKINDRLFAPNTPQTFAAVKPELQKVVVDLFGAGVSLEHRGDPKQLFEVAIRAIAPQSMSKLVDATRQKAPV